MNTPTSCDFNGSLLYHRKIPKGGLTAAARPCAGFVKDSTIRDIRAESAEPNPIGLVSRLPWWKLVSEEESPQAVSSTVSHVRTKAKKDEQDALPVQLLSAETHASKDGASRLFACADAGSTVPMPSLLRMLQQAVCPDRSPAADRSAGSGDDLRPSKESRRRSASARRR